MYAEGYKVIIKALRSFIKVMELPINLLLNVFGYVTGEGYDTPNTTNTTVSSLMSHSINFIVFLINNVLCGILSPQVFL